MMDYQLNKSGLDDEIRPLNILVVDDEQQICDLIHGFLSQSVFVEKVVSATNALQARQKMQNQDFDFIIVDYAMQGKNGIQFIQDFRKIPKYARVKVLLISGCVQEENVLQAIQLKIKDILVKPFTRKQLLAKMYRMFDFQDDKDLPTNESYQLEDATLDFSLDLDLDLDLDE